jgi:hypothetical protein
VTPDEREKFYDDEIAPALLALRDKCRENGLSFVASVEWAPNESGRTASIAEEHGAGIILTNMAAMCKGNADSLIGGMLKYGEEKGHNSHYLAMLGRTPY